MSQITVTDADGAVTEFTSADQVRVVLHAREAAMARPGEDVTVVGVDRDGIAINVTLVYTVDDGVTYTDHLAGAVR